MYTNGNVGNTDQYKISYNLLCIIIITMQEVYITCPVFNSTLIISLKRDLPCFAECCCGPGGVFHHVCEGWSSAFCGALICNENETADDHTLNNTPSTYVGCTLAPEDLEDRPPTTAGIGDCWSKESMPTSVGVGSCAAIAYGKRWYGARVSDVHNNRDWHIVWCQIFVMRRLEKRWIPCARMNVDIIESTYRCVTPLISAAKWTVFRGFKRVTK